MSNEQTNDYNNVLATCLTAVMDGERSIADCVRAYPQFADSLQQDLSIAVFTTRLDAPQMSAESVDALENRLRQMMPATAQPATRNNTPTTPQNLIPFRMPLVLSRSAAVILMVLFVAFAGSAGTVAASSDSMPGETLYPVKRLWESVIIVLATVAGNLDDVWVQLAETRLLEAQHEYGEGELSLALLNDLYEATDKALQHGANSPELQVYLVVLVDSIETGMITLDDNTNTIEAQLIDLITPALNTTMPLMPETVPNAPALIENTATATLALSPTLTPTDGDLPTATIVELVATSVNADLMIEASNTAIPPTATATSRIPPTPTRTPTPTTTATGTMLPVNVPSATFTPLPPPTLGNPPTAQVGAPGVAPSPTFDAGTPTPYPTWYPYPRLTQEAFYLTRTAEWQGNNGGG